jgi:hypothetical protein
MSDQLQTITYPAPELPKAQPTKWEREYGAFKQMLPQLLRTNYGEFVAVHEGKVFDSDRDKVALVTRVMDRVGNVEFHVGLVTEKQEQIYRSGVVRDLSAWTFHDPL